MKRHIAAAALITTGLLAAGCSSNDQDSSNNDQTAALLKTARTYQQAANRLDWHTACSMSSARLRGGTVAACVANHPAAPTNPSAPSPPSTSPSPTLSPPTYADGSTPSPITPSTPSGPDRADTGPVQASDVVTVPATGDHPAGYGVMVTYTVKWPDKPATTDRRALRLVAEGSAWAVDQHEDIQEGDQGHGSPVRTALSGE